MRFIVCISPAPDEAVRIRLGEETGKPDLGQAEMGISAFDAYALEMAVRAKEEQQDAGRNLQQDRQREEGEVIALSVCMKKDRKKHEAVLRSALAAGADKAALVETEDFPENTEPSPLFISGMLKAAIDKLFPKDGWDIIFCGKENTAGMWGQVGILLAGLMGTEAAEAAELTVKEGKAVIKRELSDRIQELETALPCLINVDRTPYDPRYPSVKSRMAARKAAIEIISAEGELLESLENNMACGAECYVVEGFSQTQKKRQGILIDRGSPKEKAEEFFLRLQAMTNGVMEEEAAPNVEAGQEKDGTEEKEEPKGAYPQETKGLLVVNLGDDSLQRKTEGLFATVSALSKAGWGVDLILFGEGNEERTACDFVKAAGKNSKVFVLRDREENAFSGGYERRLAAGIADLIEQTPPSLIMFLEEERSERTAMELARLLCIPAMKDVRRLEIRNQAAENKDGGRSGLLFWRPVFGKMLLEGCSVPFCGPKPPSVIAVLNQGKGTNLREPAEETPAVSQEEIFLPGPPPSRLKLIKEERKESSKDLVKARVIGAGGRGMESEEGFQLVKELCKTLQGSLGATRPAIEEGWAPKQCQIGNSGVSVSPRLYIACGISGAPQHMAGLEKAQIIAAVNKDSQAPIFQEADIGVVGDVKEILPFLIESFRTRPIKI